jgi:hypothetical protein
MKISAVSPAPEKVLPNKGGRKAGELTSALMMMPPMTTITIDFEKEVSNKILYPSVNRFARKHKMKFVCRRISARSFAIFRIT